MSERINSKVLSKLPIAEISRTKSVNQSKPSPHPPFQDVLNTFVTARRFDDDTDYTEIKPPEGLIDAVNAALSPKLVLLQKRGHYFVYEDAAQTQYLLRGYVADNATRRLHDVSIVVMQDNNNIVAFESV